MSQILYFNRAEQADSKGFRPCRRCRPNQADGEGDTTAHAGAVARVCRYIEEAVRDGGEGALNLESLGRRVGLSAHQVQRAFRKLVGISPRKYVDAHRMRRIKNSLQKGKDVTTALYDAGFGSSSRLYERASKQMGMTPGTYRRGGKGMTISYTTTDTPFGLILVAATERGVSAVYLGDDEKKLGAALKKEYPQATLQRDDAALKNWVAPILNHLRGREVRMDLPTDVQATAFQRRVWDELRKIPYGTTRTYTEVANLIGKPEAVRAVARACATNPVSIVVPCHRVVRTDGKLAGYRWGLGRKEALIEFEAREAGAKGQQKARTASR
jgi:AraC family transcriptional regulator, regulatory protein of adaptative response / methylated-DNA-[protein]-cysteine methyltransferase